MPRSYSTTGLILPADSEDAGVWGQLTNTNMQVLSRITSGTGTLSLSGTTTTLSVTDGALSDGQFAVLILAGSPSGTHTITVAPNDAERVFHVLNTTGETAIFTQGTGGNATIPAGAYAICSCDGAGAGARVRNLTDSLVDTTTLSTLNVTGELSLAGTAITATASEINVLDGITATVDELNILDGATVTASEINVLDGITATTAELNYVAGVTSAIQTQLDAKQAADATLTAFAGLVTGADKIPYTTSTDTFGQLDFLNEADMASNSATAVPAQASVVAYVAAQIAGSVPITATSEIDLGLLSADASAAHGLGAYPLFVQFCFECVVSEGGFDVGDRVSFIQAESANTNFNGVTGWYSTTEVGMVSDPPVLLKSKLSGQSMTLTPTSWRVYARVFS